MTHSTDDETRIADLGARLSNWGRWGTDDELGTLNHITAAVRLAAAGAVRTGQVFSLALDLLDGEPQPPGSGRLNPQHYMVETGTDVVASGAASGYSDDVLTMSLHASTHWDAVSHCFHAGMMYNGRSAALVTAAGAAVNDIRPLARTLVTRGVLVDVAAHLERPRLAPDHAISLAELQATLEAQRVDLRVGDALLIRTGHLGDVRGRRAWHELAEPGGVPNREPGITAECLPWLHESGVSAIAADNWGFEHISGPSVQRLPVHEVGLVHMGLPLGEYFELDALGAACAADARYDFLLAAGPLPITGGVGGPVNPLAIR